MHSLQLASLSVATPQRSSTSFKPVRQTKLVSSLHFPFRHSSTFFAPSFSHNPTPFAPCCLRIHISTKTAHSRRCKRDLLRSHFWSREARPARHFPRKPSCDEPGNGGRSRRVASTNGSGRGGSQRRFDGLVASEDPFP